MSTPTLRAMATDYWRRFTRFGVTALVFVAVLTGTVAIAVGLFDSSALLYHLLAMLGGALGFSAAAVDMFDGAGDPDTETDVGVSADGQTAALFMIALTAFILNLWIGTIAGIAIGTAALGASGLAVLIAVAGPVLDLLVASRTGTSILILSYRLGIRVLPPLFGVSDSARPVWPFERLIPRPS